MKQIKMTEDEFYEKFHPIKNHIDDNASFDGCSFETYLEEEKFVKETAQETPRKVWTILDCDGSLYIVSGYHFVNRLNYLITEEEFEEDVDIEIKLDDFIDG
jgi:hypothetical protein